MGEAETGLAGAKNMLSMSKLKMADFYNFKRSKYKAAQVLYNEAITIAPLSDSANVAKRRLEKIDAILAENSEAGDEIERKAPTTEELQEKARKRAKRKILGIF